jgi:Family of unknown function (DUF6188)
MKMYGLPKDFDGSRLVGRFLQQICYGLYQIQLHFDERLTIAIESTLLYRDSAMASDPKRIHIPDVPTLRSDLLQLLHHAITNASGDQEGTLAMEFDNGHVLQCLDDQPGYEAYEIKMGDESIIV